MFSLFPNKEDNNTLTKENVKHVNSLILPTTELMNAIEKVNRNETSTYLSSLVEMSLTPKSLGEGQSSSKNFDKSTSDAVTHSNEFLLFKNKTVVKNLPKIDHKKKSMTFCNDISCMLNNMNSTLPEQRMPVSISDNASKNQINLDKIHKSNGSIIVTEALPTELPVVYQKNKLYRNRIVDPNGIISVDKDLEHVNEEVNAFNLNGMEDDSEIGNRNADRLRNLFSTMPTEKTSLLKGNSQIFTITLTYSG